MAKAMSGTQTVSQKDVVLAQAFEPEALEEIKRLREQAPKAR